MNLPRWIRDTRHEPDGNEIGALLREYADRLAGLAGEENWSADNDAAVWRWYFDLVQTDGPKAAWARLLADNTRLSDAVGLR